MDDLIRCYADVFYLKTTLHLPPQPVDPDPCGEKDPTAAAAEPAQRTLPAPLRLGRWIVRGLRLWVERSAAAGPLAGKRGLRRIGG